MSRIKINAPYAQVGHTLKVLRALPTPALRSVGPFVFLDHFGPMPSQAGGPSAHPHAGIEVITWLLAGENEHRDSMGNHGKISSGGAQWMKAGRGALHAETMSGDTPMTHGLQLWVRQPLSQQEDAPAYAHFNATQIPSWQNSDAELSLLIGQYAEHTGPLKLGLDGIALRLQIAPRSHHTLTLNPLFELGLYAISGTIHCDDEALNKGDLLRLANGTQAITLHNPNTTPCDCILLGGLPAPQPLVFEGPFVFESQARINQAKQDFISGAMGRLDGVPF